MTGPESLKLGILAFQDINREPTKNKEYTTSCCDFVSIYAGAN